MQFVKAMPFAEAVDKIGARTPIGSAMLSSEWGDVPVALRERAMFSSGVESIRFLQRVQDGVTDFLTGAKESLPTGETALRVGSRAEFVDELRGFALREGLGPLDAADKGGLKDITSERRLGLIFDVQTRQADDYGYWRQGMNAEVLNEFPAQRFIRVQEVKEPRQSHIQYEDQVYLKTDAIWAKVINKDFGVPWGPWGWGCGHDVEDVDRDEAEGLGLVKKGEVVQPEVKSFNENLRASASGLEPELLKKLQGDLGSQLVIDRTNDELRWDGGGALRTASPTTVAANQNAVSGALEVRVRGYAKQLVEEGLAAIDRVHDDGVLPRVRVKETADPRAAGFLRPKATGGGLATDFIAVNKGGQWPALTMVHETGHFLDLEAIGAKGNLATRAGDADMLRVIAAAEQTAAIKGLRGQLAGTTSARARKHLSYLLSPEEVWARAYAQFIAERSGSRLLLTDLGKLSQAERWRQWETADFAPVAAEIESMFRKFGWM